MRTSNNADGTLRTGESGHQWQEVLSGAAGTITVDYYQTFRVRAAGAVTVTIDGVLAATMVSGEILIFCAGKGSNQTSSGFNVTTAAGVPIAVTGTAFVQVAADKTATPPVAKFTQPVTPTSSSGNQSNV